MCVGVRSETVLAAIKYGFLKSRIGGDIVYDPEESVATEGNSGPYLQYAHARAKSISAKSNVEPKIPTSLESGERQLVSKLTEFSSVVGDAISNLSPHLICTYLYELAQTFNRFYENNRVIDDQREAERLYLLGKYTDTLKRGLDLLGITAPDQM